MRLRVAYAFGRGGYWLSDSGLYCRLLLLEGWSWLVNLGTACPWTSVEMLGCTLKLSGWLVYFCLSMSEVGLSFSDLSVVGRDFSFFLITVVHSGEGDLDALLL